jgi:single-stranded-DNA-specific exonuclease
MGRGSGRSIEGFHLYDAITACGSHLSKFGGHKHAAGLSIEEKNLPAFREAFERFALERLVEEDLVARCRVDGVLVPNEVDEPAVNAIAALGPFGNGNPEPTFALKRISAIPRVLPNKREGAEGHLKLRLETGRPLEAIGFGMADRLPLTEGPVDLAFQLSLDEWKGVRKVSLKLKDVRASA